MLEIGKSPILYNRKKLTNDVLLDLYYHLLKPRLIEEKMLLLLRQGKVSKWFSAIGQEAISVGCTRALQEDEHIFTMHRNLGVFTSRNVDLEKLFAQWQGKKTGFTKGRDRSFHFGAPDYNIVGMISHLGAQLSLADGVALANKIRKEKKATLVFTGEGGTSEGEFHEALNIAAVWKLPVIFVVENNGYGLSTPVNEQYAATKISDKAKGYGMKGMTIDGNNILEVYKTIQKVASSIRNKPEPYLIECETFRMRGHEEASGTKYVPKELFTLWEAKDPLSNFENFLLEEKILNLESIDNLKSEIKEEIDVKLKNVYAQDQIEPVLEEEKSDVYAAFENTEIKANGTKSEMRFIDAVHNGLDLAMDKFDDLVLMGQDIAEYGGVFKATDGFVEKYGKDRVRNTPICESAVIGAGLGLSIKNMKSMVEMQFADFVTCGFNQIVNNLAKIHYRWAQNADVVVRMPTGGSVAAGPFHSQSNEAWFTHVPGLRVVYPSNPHDAKGLLLQSFEDPNPVMFFEHKALYRNLSDEIPEDYYTVPFGQANLVREGGDAVIITYGLGVHWAKQLCEEQDLDVAILDLRTLNPLDYNSIEEQVKKSNKVLVLHEDNLFGGLAGEIAAYISEHLFEHLDAPVIRCASLDTPIPFAKTLENQYLANKRLEEKLTHLLRY